jgi:hypothetical protein
MMKPIHYFLHNVRRQAVIEVCFERLEPHRKAVIVPDVNIFVIVNACCHSRNRDIGLDPLEDFIGPPPSPQFGRCTDPNRNVMLCKGSLEALQRLREQPPSAAQNDLALCRRHKGFQQLKVALPQRIATPLGVQYFQVVENTVYVKKKQFHLVLS